MNHWDFSRRFRKTNQGHLQIHGNISSKSPEGTEESKHKISYLSTDNDIESSESHMKQVL